MPGITATIITFNEEDRIAEALASLACCDEVLVVDSGSTDRTREIASKLGARVIAHPWEGYSKQKNFAAEKAANDWILSIDADERLSIELADEIIKWKHNNPLPLGEGRVRVERFEETCDPHPTLFQGERAVAAAFSMPRRAFYLGKWINHSGWYPDRKIRLYHRKYGRWEGIVHEHLKVDGAIEKFRGDLLHFPFRDWHDQVARREKYTQLAVDAARSSRSHGSLLRLIFGPPIAFVRGFFFHVGFLDGWRGLAIAYMGARYVFQREFRILRSWNWRWL